MTKPHEYPVQIDDEEVKLVVVTVSTDETWSSRNFVRSLRKYGYDHVLLARGEKWQGWKWRTRKYIDFLKRLPPGDRYVVCISDSNDVLMARPSSDLLRRFLTFKAPIVVGGESMLIGGDMYQESRRWETYRKLREKMTPEDWRRVRNKFPQAGFVMGWRDDMLQLLLDNQHEHDDQNGLMNRYLENMDRFYLDTCNDIVGNLGSYACIRMKWKGPVDIAPWESEEDHWYLDKDSHWRNKVTGGSPCLFHFPAKNWSSYCNLGSKLGIEGFENTPPNVTNHYKEQVQTIPEAWQNLVINIWAVSSILVVFLAFFSLGFFTYGFDMTPRTKN